MNFGKADIAAHRATAVFVDKSDAHLRWGWFILATICASDPVGIEFDPRRLGKAEAGQGYSAEHAIREDRSRPGSRTGARVLAGGFQGGGQNVPQRKT